MVKPYQKFPRRSLAVVGADPTCQAQRLPVAHSSYSDAEPSSCRASLAGCKDGALGGGARDAFGRAGGAPGSGAGSCRVEAPGLIVLLAPKENDLCQSATVLFC